MATDCKKPFQVILIQGAAPFLISIIGHLALFTHLSSTLSSGHLEKLLGQKGGPIEATEVSFFPSFSGTGKSQTEKRPNGVEIPTSQTPSRTQASDTAQGTASRGIGEGGTSTNYHSLLHAYLDSEKVFPRSLKELGLSGVVRVRFQVTKDGYLENIELVDAQAPKPLQHEALRFLKKLERVPVPPTELTENQLQFELPLRYELKS